MKNESKRLARIDAAIEKLRQGKHVQNRQLKTLLGEDGYNAYLSSCQSLREFGEYLRAKPEPVTVYERKLKKATFTYNKADAASRAGRLSAAESLFHQARSEFERLAEYISEQIAPNAELCSWFDRCVQYDATNAPHTSPQAFPRVVTSRSAENAGGGILANKQSVREIKLGALELAREKFGGGEEDLKLSERLENARALHEKYKNWYA